VNGYLSYAHLPAAVSLLLLEALFVQISGGSLTLTWPCRLCLLRFLLGTTATVTSFPLSKHTGGGDTAPSFSGLCVFYSSIGKWVFPPLLWSFPPTAAFTSFPAPGCWACAATPAFSSPPSLFIYSSVRDCPSPPSVLRTPRPLCYVSFLLLLLIIQFSFFFPWVGVGLSRGLCWSGPGLSVGVPCAA
jgi:hypothetical protein